MAFIDRMAGQDYIEKTRQYLDYLEEHLENVRLAFIELSNACDGMMWVGDDCAWHTLRQDVINHDLSKFSKFEFTQYRNKFFTVDGEEIDVVRFALAWEHHKEKNRHHHETAENYHDVVHMIVDWTAMGYKFGDTAQEYYEANKDKINISDEHRDFMYEIFEKVAAYRKAS